VYCNFQFVYLHMFNFFIYCDIIMSITVSANGTCCFQEDSKDAVKPWDRPWTTNEMRQQSSNWNLAGDAGLLKHLQQFSQV